MYTNIELNETISRHTDLKRKVSEREKKLLPDSIKELSQEEYRFYLGGSDDDFKRMLMLLVYYIYLDELDFVTCKKTKLKESIFNTIRSKHYLLNEHNVLNRNLLFIPTLNRIGICNKEETWVKTSPLCIILSSLSDKERASRFAELHPASHSKGTQLSRENKVWSQENRQSIESYREIISEFTGESYTNFEESSPVEFLKVLYLLISSNQRYALSIKPLLKSLNNKPHEPMFDTTYDLSYIVDIEDNGEKTKNFNFLNTRDKNNPNLTKAILNELLTYLLDSCEPNKARSIREISIAIRSLKTDLLGLYDSGYSDRHIKKIIFMQLDKLLNPFTSLRMGKSLFEKMSLSMVIKDIVNQLISEKEVLLIASASYEEREPTFNHYQKKIAQDDIFKRILKNRNSLPKIGVSKKQSSNSLSHRKTLAIFGLHHYLKSIGILSDNIDFDIDELSVILLIVFDESERRTQIPFIKNIPSSDNLGTTSTWNSLLRYSIAVMFSSDTTPNKTASHFMPYVHQLFWQERYQQVLRLMYTPDSYNRYVSSKQLLLTNLINFLNKPSILTRERLISYFFSMKI